ncbi:Flagellar biosynthetic protein FliP precursor [Aquisphaera giovannonii]|uniref:Flagellar biosynthetic protein FliP n=1 Tax=Aquisphaera giovannonii TaxID=406548 RepID=A0A5B9W4X3_9BACT|nr:flagellar type III secretion system pore protein FliP [Aquisphaera giovannonii]QEH35746.1 Flagellar biosynthetic protein FliP precursor [Aquisphaera giovannonii]
MTGRGPTIRRAALLVTLAALAFLAAGAKPCPAQLLADSDERPSIPGFERPRFDAEALRAEAVTVHATPPGQADAAAPGEEPAPAKPSPLPDARDAMRTASTMALYGLMWLAPMGVLMLTAFVRIEIVLVLLRQAMGSPQVPSNQVLMVLALLLTALVMRPVGERVYQDAIVPLQAGKAAPAEAWEAGSAPIKGFMVDQIVRTKHADYLWALYHHARPPGPGRAEPKYGHEFPFRIVAPAYLLSELTTALVMGFYLYLPFLVIDLAVSAVLAAMGLYMLPPTLVAMPVKMIVFVLADGWLLVSTMLLSSFAGPGG